MGNIVLEAVGKTWATLSFIDVLGKKHFPLPSSLATGWLDGQDGLGGWVVWLARGWVIGFDAST